MTGERMQMTALLTTFLLWSLHFTTNEAISQIDQEIKKSDSGACPVLKNPDHGSYECESLLNGRHQVCELVCDPGYTLPLMEYHDKEDIPLKDRGLYVCETFSGGRIWKPNIFFDCVEEILPTHFKLYYPYTLPYPTPCTDDDVKKADNHLAFARKSVNNGNGMLKCRLLLNETCSWDITLGCDNGSWEMDAFFNIPFKFKYIDIWRYWHDDLMGFVKFDRVQLRLRRQRQLSVERRPVLFFIDCPEGSRLEKDYTCRGCAKGYYLAGEVSECRPCPIGYYQDENYQLSCKQCPEGSKKDETALRSRIDCYFSGKWATSTSVNTLMASLMCVVAFCTVMLAYRNQVMIEPDGQSPEFYGEDILTLKRGGSDRSGGDHRMTLVPEVGSKLDLRSSGAGDAVVQEVPVYDPAGPRMSALGPMLGFEMLPSSDKRSDDSTSSIMS